MSRELMILVISWITSIVILVSVSRGRIALTQITFLATQTIAWVFEYILVYFDLVQFPYREFEAATKMSFSLYYMIFPTVGVLFILYYPKSPSKLKVILYYLFFCMVIPTYSSVAEKYSDLFLFIHWNWPVHVLADLIIFYILKKFIFWFKEGLES